MKEHSQQKVPLEIILFDFDGSVLAKQTEQ